jgi:hypothetical protein
MEVTAVTESTRTEATARPEDDGVPPDVGAARADATTGARRGGADTRLGDDVIRTRSTVASIGTVAAHH